LGHDGGARAPLQNQYPFKSVATEGSSPVVLRRFGRWVGRESVRRMEFHLHPWIQTRIINSEQSTVRERI